MKITKKVLKSWKDKCLVVYNAEAIPTELTDNKPLILFPRTRAWNPNDPFWDLLSYCRVCEQYTGNNGNTFPANVCHLTKEHRSLHPKNNLPKKSVTNTNLKLLAALNEKATRDAKRSNQQAGEIATPVFRPGIDARSYQRMNYKEGILAAIAGLNDRRYGSSELAIRRYMQSRMPENKKWLNNVFLRVLKELRLENEIYKVKTKYKLVSPARKKKIRLSNELNALCASESLSLGSLSELFDRYGLAANNDWNINFFFHRALKNKSVDEEIIQLLLEYFPGALNHVNNSYFGGGESSPLLIACGNENVSFNIIRLLIESSPDSIQIEYDPWHDTNGTPLHCFCRNYGVDETTAIEILRLFLEKFPGAARHEASYEHNLPIHFASSVRSVQFCHMLIQAYPESVQSCNTYGALPLHYACLNNDVATVEYLYKLYPDAINQTSDEQERFETRDTLLLYPIHYAILSHNERIVRFLMSCDPVVKSQKVDGMSPLHFACLMDLNVDYNYDDSDVESGMRVIKAVYSADPEAIKEESFRSDLHRCREQVQSFIKSIDHMNDIYRLRGLTLH